MHAGGAPQTGVMDRSVARASVARWTGWPGRKRVLLAAVLRCASQRLGGAD